MAKCWVVDVASRGKKRTVWEVHVTWREVPEGRKVLEKEGLYSRKRNALAGGVALAKLEHCELFVHNKDGKISERRSYGNDPKRRKG